jgi:hypothetical protein
MATPSYIRVYLDRFGSDTELYELIYFLGIFKPDFSNPLFPDATTDVWTATYPRKKVSFNSDKYVDIPMENSDVVSFYIQRKDGHYVYNGELCGTENIDDGPLCPFCWETGYNWTIDTGLNSQGTYYIKEGKPYVYKDNSYNSILPFGVSLAVTDGDLDDDEDENTKTYGDKFRLFYDFKNFEVIDIPEEAYMTPTLWGGDTEPSQFTMLYLRGKTFNNIGVNNMDLSLSADALQAQKDDAKSMLESGVANSLFKLGEDIDAFDEDAFLADVDGYKEGKDASLHGIIDYMKVCLDNLAALA